MLSCLVARQTRTFGGVGKWGDTQRRIGSKQAMQLIPTRLGARGGRGWVALSMFRLSQMVLHIIRGATEHGRRYCSPVDGIKPQEARSVSSKTADIPLWFQFPAHLSSEHA